MQLCFASSVFFNCESQISKEVSADLVKHFLQKRVLAMPEIPLSLGVQVSEENTFPPS